MPPNNILFYRHRDCFLCRTELKNSTKIETPMKKTVCILSVILVFNITNVYAQTQKKLDDLGKIKVVAQLKIRPGNTAVSKNGRIFSTIHPLGENTLQLVEITGTKSYTPFPSDNYQKYGKTTPDNKLDSPLGIVFDSQDRLWTIDMGLELGQTRLWCFNIRNKKQLDKIVLPQSVAPKGSFIQDLAVDDENGWAYLADIANPGIIAINLKTKETRRFGNHPSLEPENIDMVIDGNIIDFNGQPLRVGINPITLSTDKQTLYFGAMSGQTWYEVPTRLFREGISDAIIASAIKVNGQKPQSDGACTAASGNHYFTDVQRHAVTKLSTDGSLSTLAEDQRLNWPDSVYFGPDQYIYVSVNQLDSTPAFTGKKDSGQPPYLILKVFAGEDGAQK